MTSFQESSLNVVSSRYPEISVKHDKGTQNKLTPHTTAAVKLTLRLTGRVGNLPHETAMKTVSVLFRAGCPSAVAH